jgi:hypothetical protein
MYIGNTPYNWWKWIHFARLNRSSEVVTAATTAQTQAGGYVLSLHQTKLCSCNILYMGKRQRKQCEVYWTPAYHCHHFMAGLDTLILVCGFHHANLKMDAWPQELPKCAVNNYTLLYIYCFVHCNLILVFCLTITNIITVTLLSPFCRVFTVTPWDKHVCGYVRLQLFHNYKLWYM